MGVHRVLGELQQALAQLLVIHIFGPEIGVSGNHSVERADGPAAGFVHYLELDPYLFVLAVLDHSVSELGVVGRGHLLDAEEHTPGADDVVRQVVHVVDGAVVAYVTGVDGAVGDAARQPQVVKLQAKIAHATYPYRSEELVVLDERGGEFVGHPYGIPA